MFGRKALSLTIIGIVLPALLYAVYPAVTNSVPLRSTSDFKACASTDCLSRQYNRGPFDRGRTTVIPYAHGRGHTGTARTEPFLSRVP
jgi:hypothetical protein